MPRQIAHCNTMIALGCILEKEMETHTLLSQINGEAILLRETNSVTYSWLLRLERTARILLIHNNEATYRLHSSGGGSLLGNCPPLSASPDATRQPGKAR